MASTESRVVHTGTGGHPALMPIAHLGNLHAQLDVRSAFEQLRRYATDLQDALRERELAYQQLYVCVKDLQDVIAQRDRALADADAAAAAKSQLLGNISHEFRTPLTAILGFAEFLSRHAKDTGTRDLLSRIHKAGKRIEGMVNNLLTMVRLNSGTLPVDVVACDVPAVLRRECAQFEERALAKGLTLLVDLPDIPLDAVMLDEVRVRQALAILLDNALQFTATGGITVTLVADADSRVPLRIDVADTGIGILAADRQRILKSFEQADGGSTRAFGGAGLGLTVAEALLGIIGCNLTFDSEPGRGSVFSIVFPDAAGNRLAA